MKKLLIMALICAMVAGCLCGCGKKDKDPEASATEVPTGGLTQALEEGGSGSNYVINDEEFDELSEPDENEPMDTADDEPIEETTTAETESESNHTVIMTNPQNEVMPFATEAPQPNAVITSFSECKDTGLGFKFNYPSGWTNFPGRSTVCFVQPMTNGTVYPGRVSVTMKKLNHSCGLDDLKDETMSYYKNLGKQFSKVKPVVKELNTDQDFMGKKALSFEYVAYDGKQEIKGYVILTHIERYVFAFHFLCAYGDYNNFYPAVIKMRDSVQVEQEK